MMAFCVVEMATLYLRNNCRKNVCVSKIRRIDEEVRLFIIEGIGKAYEEIERALA